MISEKQKKKILSTVNKYWRSVGHWWVDTQGVVHGTGLLNPRPRMKFPDGRLPVKFGDVKGDLNLSDMGLTTLEGAPDTVTGWLYLGQNLITSLAHAPRKVGMLSMGHMPELVSLEGSPQEIDIGLQLHSAPKLSSLDGLPSTPGSINSLTIPYVANMPLLKTLVAQKIHIIEEQGIYTILQEVQPLNQILNDSTWVGKGKAGALNCALALKKAGYVDNAKW